MSGIVTKKSLSRLATVQAIYMYELNGRVDDISELIETTDCFYKDPGRFFDEADSLVLKYNKKYFEELFNAVIDNLNIVDEIIKKVFKETMDFSKVGCLLLAVLRAGTTEIKFFPDVPIKVVINEFTNIASELLNDSDIGLVNSLLDNIAKHLRK